MLPQHVIVKSTQSLSKGQRHERMEKYDHRKQSEKWDGEYKCVYPCKGRWEGEDHMEGLGERLLGMERWQWSEEERGSVPKVEERGKIEET